MKVISSEMCIIVCIIEVFMPSLILSCVKLLTLQASSVGGKKHSVNTDYILKVLGLDICSDTIVGNDMVRGVSGGQRKRVTTGFSLFFRN
jgi:ABC-type multidrug transport system ATPase subunit